MTDLRIEVGDRRADAATVWAEATAARDGDPEIAPLSASLPIIERVLDSSPHSLLILAIDGDDRVIAFAAVEADGPTAHIRYVGVRPTAWGGGVGRRLMTALPGLATGFTRAELAVYQDNQRAVALYESLGWKPLGEPQPHPRSGRLEQRYEIAL